MNAHPELGCWVGFQMIPSLRLGHIEDGLEKNLARLLGSLKVGVR